MHMGEKFLQMNCKVDELATYELQEKGWKNERPTNLFVFVSCLTTDYREVLFSKTDDV